MTDRLPSCGDEEIKELLGKTKELAFLHAPKTGGTYVAHQLLGDPAFNHVALRQAQPALGRVKPTEKERWIHYLDNQYARHNLKIHLLKHYYGPLESTDETLVFGTVRNPFDWLVSLYASNFRGFLSIPRKPGCAVTLEEFIESFIKLGRASQKRFAITGNHWDNAARPRATIEEITTGPGFIELEHYRLSASPLYQFFFNRQKPQISFALRQEILDAAVEKVIYYFVRCDEDFNYVRGHDANVSNRTNINNTNKNAEDYKDIFCPAAREMVEEHYKWELDLLGYDFEKGVLDDNPILDFRNAKWPSEAEGLK